MTAARTTRALLRALLAGCLVLSLGAALTGQAHAAWRPTGRGSVSGKATILPPPIATLTPPPGSTCATSRQLELRWELGTYQTFSTQENGVPFLRGYSQAVGPKGNLLNEWYVTVDDYLKTNPAFTVSYTNGKWTATSTPVRCKDR
jgi:hypothetical protein